MIKLNPKKYFSSILAQETESLLIKIYSKNYHVPVLLKYKKIHYCPVNNSILSVSYKRECKQFVNLANKY